MDALVAICDKAIGYPRPGLKRNGGRHGPTPAVYAEGAPGWTRHWRASWVANASTAATPLSDADVAEVTAPRNTARLTAGEIATLNTEAGSRSDVDLEAGYSPKRRPGSGVASGAGGGKGQDGTL